MTSSRLRNTMPLPPLDIAHEPWRHGRCQLDRLPPELLVRICEQVLRPATNLVRCVDVGIRSPQYALGTFGPESGCAASAYQDRAAFAQSHDRVHAVMAGLATKVPGYRVRPEAGWSRSVLDIPWASRRDLFYLRNDAGHGWSSAGTTRALENAHLLDNVTHAAIGFARSPDRPRGSVLVVPTDAGGRGARRAARALFWLLHAISVRRLHVVLPQEVWERACRGDASAMREAARCKRGVRPLSIVADLVVPAGPEGPFEGPSELYYAATDAVLQEAGVPEVVDVVAELRRLSVRHGTAWTVGVLIGWRYQAA
jgi:hypothetical protein